MGLLEIILLAVVQGVTEFLPVSSSGHLVVAGAVLQALGYAPPQDLLEVNIALHVGTLVAILVYYWRELVRLATSDRRVVPLLIVGTIPAVLIGVPMKKFGTDVLESPLVAGCMFAVTAAVLIWASRRPAGERAYRELGYGGAVKIGLLQALALLPGVSRSGATIAGGLACGLDRVSAGTFAFLLAVPAIGGAGLWEAKDLWEQRTANEATAEVGAEAARSSTSAASDGETGTAPPTAPWLLFVGAVVAMGVGWCALAWLIRWIRAGRLEVFAWYLVPLSVAVITWQLAS